MSSSTRVWGGCGADDLQPESLRGRGGHGESQDPERAGCWPRAPDSYYLGGCWGVSAVPSTDTCIGHVHMPASAIARDVYGLLPEPIGAAHWPRQSSTRPSGLCTISASARARSAGPAPDPVLVLRRALGFASVKRAIYLFSAGGRRWPGPLVGTFSFYSRRTQTQQDTSSYGTCGGTCTEYIHVRSA